MRDRTGTDEERAYAERMPAYTRERLSDLFIKHHQSVAQPPKYNKATRRFECGDKACGAAYKTVQELERHYQEAHTAVTP